MNWKNTIRKEIWDSLNEEMKEQPISSFEQKIRSQSVPIEELDDNRVRCVICKGSADYKTPVKTGGKDTYLCDKCLNKALNRHMKDKEQKEREDNAQ